MIFFILIIAEIVILYFLSRSVIRRTFVLLNRLAGRKSLGMYLFAILFLPGTFIHEMSHFLAALFLLVPVGKLDVFPKFKENTEGIDLGSVSIAKTDPLRRFLIGIAPVIFGVGVISVIMYYLFSFRADISVWMYVAAGIVVFEVANSMFASRKDMEGAITLLVFICLIAVIIIALGIDFPFLSKKVLLNEVVVNISKQASIFLLVPIAIDSVVLFILKKL